LTGLRDLVLAGAKARVDLIVSMPGMNPQPTAPVGYEAANG